MYISLIRKLENLFVFLMTYIVPVVVIVFLLLLFFHIVPAGESQESFANGGLALLIFVLGIKPISLLIKRYLNPIYRTLPEGISYVAKGWTENPILIYIQHLIVNTVYSICLYGLRLRKRLGILVFWLIFLHRSILEIVAYQHGAPLLLLRSNWMIQTGVVGLAALVIAGITSNMFSIRLLKRRWKFFQQFAYLAFLGACLHLFFLQHDRTYIIVMIVYAGLKIWERRPQRIQAVVKQAEPGEAIPDVMRARIINRKLLTQDILELTLDVNQELKILPGQRVMLRFKDAEGDVERAYSIVDFDVDQGSTLFVLAIKLVSGRGTTDLAAMKIGDELGLKGIYGKFVLQATDAPKVFIATGVGISPLLCMAKYSESKDKKFYFSVPTLKELFYEERIKTIHDLTYEIHITRENIPGYAFGRLDIDKADIDPQSEIYVCGNPKVVEAIIQDLKAKGYKYIFSETF
ncbi:MAG: FAD-binding oxidoreductase [candidate division SR1 bacterium]|nr:FAD-binding oxidoreductase [candidate division SR1 bacterium]